MSYTIPANDFGKLRVFATDMDLPQEAIKKTPEGILALLGAPLNVQYVDIVKVADLGGMALSRYIEEGYDMPPDLVEQSDVDGIRGNAVLVLSSATGGKATELHPGFGLRHVATYSRTPDVSTPATLQSQSAAGTVPQPADPPPKAKSNARIGGMVATVALIAMFVLVGVMIFVGG